jgi:hypothetical protein
MWKRSADYWEMACRLLKNPPKNQGTQQDVPGSVLEFESCGLQVVKDSVPIDTFDIFNDPHFSQ